MEVRLPVVWVKGEEKAMDIVNVYHEWWGVNDIYTMTELLICFQYAKTTLALAG